MRRQRCALLCVPYHSPAHLHRSGGVLCPHWAHARDGTAALLGTGTQVRFGPCDQYALMVEDFAAAVADGRKTDLSESRDLVRVLSEWLGE